MMSEGEKEATAAPSTDSRERDECTEVSGK